MFWQRVDIQGRAKSQTSTGAEVPTWPVSIAGIEARLLPLVHGEKDTDWATAEEEAYEVHLRGAQPSVVPEMRVVAGGSYFDIRQVIQPPPFGTPVTVLATVKVTP